MSDEQARMQILEMIESGKVSPSEGLRLLESLRQPASAEPAQLPEEAVAAKPSGAAAYTSPSGSGASAGMGSTFDHVAAEEPGERVSEPEVLGPTPKFEVPPGMRRWRRWWLLPFWLGVGTTILGGLFMYLAVMARGVSFWLVLASLPFIAGLVLTVLAWQARNARWLHLRVDNIRGEGPKRIALSFPLPLRTASWVLRVFGHKIPKMEGVPIDEILKSLEKNASAENPLYIAVNDEDDGERVEIYIG